jgi:hypothetical protein
VAFDGGNCFTAGGFPSNPLPVRVCAEQNFKQLNHAFKGPIWQKIGQGSNLLSQKPQKIRLIAMSFNGMDIEAKRSDQKLP